MLSQGTIVFVVQVIDHSFFVSLVIDQKNEHCSESTWRKTNININISWDLGTLYQLSFHIWPWLIWYMDDLLLLHPVCTLRRKVLPSTYFLVLQLVTNRGLYPVPRRTKWYLERPWQAHWGSGGKGMLVQVDPNMPVMVLPDTIWSFQVLDRVLYLWQAEASKIGASKCFFTQSARNPMATHCLLLLLCLIFHLQVIWNRLSKYLLLELLLSNQLDLSQLNLQISLVDSSLNSSVDMMERNLWDASQIFIIGDNDAWAWQVWYNFEGWYRPKMKRVMFTWLDTRYPPLKLWNRDLAAVT